MPHGHRIPPPDPAPGPQQDARSATGGPRGTSVSLPDFCDETLPPTRLPRCHRILGATDSSAEQSTRPLALSRWV